MLAPNTSTTTNKTMKIKKNTFAMDAAPAAIPPKPNMPAITAMIKKMMA